MSKVQLSVLPVFENYPLAVRKQGEGVQVQDPIRRKWVSLLPEEYVRQQLIQHLLALGFPAARILIEKSISTTSRVDIQLLSKEFLPICLVECKSEQVQLQNNTIQQTIRYNLNLQCPYSIITNGRTVLVCSPVSIENWNELIQLLISC